MESELRDLINRYFVSHPNPNLPCSLPGCIVVELSSVPVQDVQKFKRLLGKEFDNYFRENEIGDGHITLYLKADKKDLFRKEFCPGIYDE
ncbi:MAG: hypothetical protein SPL78_05365 [Bacteroidales bacterium]|nr:hypothetical protein [Bacteroidales bacterium]